MNWLRLIFNSLFFRFLFVFLWASFVLMALDPDKRVTQYSIQKWNMEGGLPGNIIFAIRQTQDGYIWIGTQDGLVRFDGLNFELFTKENIFQLKDNEIRALCDDRNGVLWIGTESGGLTRYKEGEFTVYPIEKHKALYKIRAINEDRWGNLWIGSFTGGLTSLRNGKFTTYTIKQGLPHNQVRNIYKDGNGDLWVITTAGIVKLLKPGIFQNYASQDDLPHTKTACLYRTETGELWIGTRGSGLYRWKNRTFTGYGTEAGFPHRTITYLYEDKEKNLWIGTDDGGLTRMRNGIFSTFPVGDELAAGFVSSIYEDREGSLWVGILDKGLYQLRDSKFTTTTTSEGLVHNDILCIHEDRAGNLWIGTKKGLNRLELKKGPKETGPLPTGLTGRQELLNELVVCLFEDPSGYLWIGTLGGLHRFRDEKLDTFTESDGLCDNGINYINGDREGNTWIGTQGGLNRYSPGSGQFRTFTTREGLSSNIIRFIFEDSRGHLWVGTGGGLNRLKDGIIKAFKPEPGMENYSFRCAHEDNKGTLWFGTDSSLIRFRENQTFLYTVKCGLSENDVLGILEDERGYIWLAGRNGISRVNKKELEDFSVGKIPRVQPDLYNENDGMKSRWCNGVGLKTRDGRFWFPTTVGVAMIDPNHIKKDTISPITIIEKVIVDGVSIETHAKVKGAKPLELAPGKKWLGFNYRGISFINPQRIQFKVRLAGQNSNWVEMGTARSTTYTDLPPSSYTFSVTSRIPGGTWDEEGASFSFYLKPYFYQTTWFYPAVVFFILLIAFSFYRFRVLRLKARTRELEIMVAERTEQLAEANKDLKHQSNMDSLTGIANRRRFMEFLAAEWVRMMRIGSPLAMIMIDVDFFKKYNDTYGHLAGDNCLKKAAGVIASAARRPGDLAARYGGEEFVIVLSGASKESAYKIAEDIRTRVESLKIPHSSSPTGFVTISLGVSVMVPYRGERMENLISLADQALYLSKEEGRNRVSFFTGEYPEDSSEGKKGPGET